MCARGPASREATSQPILLYEACLQSEEGADILHIQYDCGFFGTFSLFGLSLSGMYTPMFYLLANRWGGPKIVTTVHEVQDAKKNYGGSLIYLPLHLYYSAIYRAMVALSAAVIVHTEGTVKTLAQYTAVSNASIIPLAIHVKPEIRPIESSKAKLGQAGKRIVLMFGFISPGKGHDLAIEMMRRGLPEDVVLYLAGEGRTPKDADYVRGLKEKVRSEGLGEKVFFHGYVVRRRDAHRLLCSGHCADALPPRSAISGAESRASVPETSAGFRYWRFRRSCP